jgi:hypothetical protein
MITIIGEAYDPLGHSWNGHKVDTAELRSRQEAPIPLTLDHDEIVGEVLTLTRVKGGAVYAIAVTHDDRCDPFLEVDQPIFFSPATDSRAIGGGDGIVLELALTLRTARVAAKPVVLKAGDIRSSSDRGRWSLRGLAYELVPRAAEEIRCRPKGGPFHIRDLEHEKWMERENERRTYVPLPLARSNPGPGQLVAPQERAGWKPGDLEWSRHPGKILSVR